MIGLCCHNIKHQEHQHNTKHDFFCSGVEPDAPPPRRILIVASSGCMGKSTLAKTVAPATGGVHLEMDDLCWTPGWQRRPPEAERKVVEEATRPESWVCAGIWGK